MPTNGTEEVEEVVEMTLANLLSAIEDIFEEIVTLAGSVVTFITTNPLVLIFFVISLAFLGVGLVKRLAR